MRCRCEHGHSRGSVRWGALIGAAAAAFLCATAALATFNSGPTTGGPMTVSSKRVFPGIRAMVAHDLRDASSGAESNSSDPNSYADGLTFQTSTAIASGTNRYVEYTMGSTLPSGLSVSGAQFKYRLASASVVALGNACFWFDVRSGGSVIGTHGSYASPAGCSASNTQTTVSTALPEVTNTDQMNGLVIRAYVWETSVVTMTVKVDMATVTGSTPYQSFTAYENQVVDDTSGTPTTTAWSLASADGTAYTAANNWPAASATTKYLKLGFDPSVPSGAVVTGVTLTNVWKPSAAPGNGGTLCYYFETFSGSTSLATHGSAGSPVRCNAATSNVTDSVSLPEVNDATKASNLVIKLYYWISPTCGGLGNPSCVKSVTDQAQANFNYYLD